MKDLRYLKLFEAFESEKLSKTLAYIDDDSKRGLIDRLRDICSSIDFPFSQLNDSHFKYLPYKSALNLRFDSEKSPCTATSKDVFGSSGIKGEVCQNGKIKRTWGSGQRIVECPSCEGSGIRPETAEIKILKFWFTKDGQFVTTTGVDNTTEPKLKQKQKLKKYSKNISDYNLIGSEMRGGSSRAVSTFISSLNHGDLVYAKLRSWSDSIICYVWKEGPKTYLLQNEHDGDTPDDINYLTIARLSWNITHGEFSIIQKVEPKVKPEEDDEDDEPEIDPFSFNKSVSFGSRGRVEFHRWTGSSADTEERVKKAHFALIFDLDSLKKSTYRLKSDIKSERTELKSGSRLVVNDEAIKKANIERYMRELAEKSDIINDVNKLPKVVKRFIGGENVIFYMIPNSRFVESLSKLAENYFNALKDQSSLPHATVLSNLIKDKYKSISSSNSYIKNTIKVVKDRCESQGLTDHVEIIEGLETIGRKIYQKISEMPLECVQDIDIAKAKLESLRQIFTSGRYALHYLTYFIDSLSNPENAFRYLTNHHYVRDNKDQIMEGIKNAIKVVDRF